MPSLAGHCSSRARRAPKSHPILKEFDALRKRPFVFMEIIKWDIYEIRAGSVPITGVMFRGRIRKFFLEKNRNVLTENTQDIEGSVRFAIPAGEDSSEVKDYIDTISPGTVVELVKENIPNPVLSKLIVNIEDRYTL